jgi:hypothetical protein
MNGKYDPFDEIGQALRLSANARASERLTLAQAEELGAVWASRIRVFIERFTA